MTTNVAARDMVVVAVALTAMASRRASRRLLRADVNLGRVVRLGSSVGRLVGRLVRLGRAVGRRVRRLVLVHRRGRALGEGVALAVDEVEALKHEREVSYERR